MTSALDPEDYYLENGNVVFTSAFHLKRGSCCGSGCRHCPYGNAGTPLPEGNQRPDESGGGEDEAG